MIRTTNNKNGYVEMAAIVIDGGHFSYAMNEAIDRYATKNNVNFKNIHVSVNMLLGKIEQKLNIKFDANHKFFYQGTDTGRPNDFHKKLEEQYGMHVGIHSMKKQGGKPTSPPHGQQQLTIKIPAPPTIVEPVENAFTLFKIMGVCCAPVFYVGRQLSTLCRIISTLVSGASNNTPDGDAEIASAVELPAQNICKKVYIKVERGVDVQIATKVIECANGLCGMAQFSKIVVLTGDADFESAFLSASHVSEVIVISQASGLSPFLVKYLPNQCSINIDELMESCISVNYIAKPQPIVPQVSNTLSPKSNLNIAPSLTTHPKKIKNNFATVPKNEHLVSTQSIPPIKSEQHVEYSNETDQSLEVATLLHHFIATKHKDKPFFSVEMALFYNDGNESLKQYIQKVKIKSICDKWPSLLETATYCSKGPRIMLSQSDRSMKLIKGYFSHQYDFNKLPMQNTAIAPALEIVIAPALEFNSIMEIAIAPALELALDSTLELESILEIAPALELESFVLLSNNLTNLSNNLDEYLYK